MRRLLLVVICFGILISCEDVIDVDLNESEPKLVIEAGVFHFKEQDRNRAQVVLSMTTPFFSNTPDPVEGASVIIISDDGTTYPLEEANGGIYFMEGFPLEEDIAYTLEVVHDEQLYTATEQLVKVASLEFVEQENDGGFSGEEVELKAFFDDPGGIDNYYFFEGSSEKGRVYDAFNDEFFDGNSIFTFYSVEDIEPGDEVTFKLNGVDQQFHDFMFTLLQQTSGQMAGPFETQPATVRGNIVNTTDPDNFPLGYFRISEVSTLSYTVQ